MLNFILLTFYGQTLHLKKWKRQLNGINREKEEWGSKLQKFDTEGDLEDLGDKKGDKNNNKAN